MDWQDEHFEASPWNPVRSTGDDEEMDNVRSNLALEEDFLASFDVKSDDKDFLSEMLRVAPKDEVKNLQKAPGEDIDLEKIIRNFAKGHPIYEQLGGKVDDVVLVEFQNDVFEFSRATGRRKNKAKADARRAVATWMQYVGMDASYITENKIEDKKVTPVLTHAIEYYKIAKTAGNGESKKQRKKKKKKRGNQQDENLHINRQSLFKIRDDNDVRVPSFVDTAEAGSERPTIPGIGKKRKRGRSQHVVAQDAVEESIQANRQQKDSAKQWQEDKYSEASFTIPMDADGYAGKVSEFQDSPVTSFTMPLPVQQTATDSTKPKNMGPTPGPTTSAYFAKPEASPIDYISLKMEDILLPPGQSRRQRKRQRRAALKDRRAEKARLHDIPQTSQSVKFTGVTSDRTDDVDMDGASFPQDLETVKIIDGVIMEAPVFKDRYLGDSTGDDRRKRKRRQKRRNKNRLDETQTGSSALRVNEQNGRNGLQQTGLQDKRELPDQLVERTRSLNLGSSANFPAEQKREHQVRGRSPKRQATAKELEGAAGEQGNPLAQLENVPANNQKRERRDRGRGRKPFSLVEPRDQGSASGKTSLDAQVSRARANSTDIFARSVGSNEESRNDLPVRPRQKSHNAQVILYATGVPAAIGADSPVSAPKDEENTPKSINDLRSQAASSQKRDSKGRFGRSLISTVESSTLLVQSKERSGSRARSQKAHQPKRDSSGRFSGNFVAVDEPSSSPKVPRGRSRNRSKTATTPEDAFSQDQISQARLRSGRRTSASSQLTHNEELSNTEATEPSGSRRRSLNATSQERDSKGRFSRAGKAAKTTPKKTRDKKTRDRSRSIRSSSRKRDPKGRFSVVATTVDAASDDEVQSPIAQEAVDTELVGSGEELHELDKKVLKAKKAKTPVKSPYFATGSSPPPADELDNSGVEKTPQTPKKRISSKSPKTPKASNGGETPKKPRTPRTPGGTVSCIPFPPLDAPYFGLIQEKLGHNPFRLLIAVTFLIRTHGKHAIPVFYKLMEKYPTPESLVAANKEDIVPLIRHLGLQNQRAGTYQTYAKIWLENPPVKEKRYSVRDYPTKGAARDMKKDEILTDEDERIAWEIGHITQGPYAIDSWRIFCRDVLRGVAEGWNGEGAKEDFQPEWMRVLPEDKELRAYLRWMWLKEGFEWNPFTGDKEVASEHLTRAAMEGKIAWDDMGGMRILDDPNGAAMA